MDAQSQKIKKPNNYNKIKQLIFQYNDIVYIAKPAIKGLVLLGIIQNIADEVHCNK